MLTPCRRLNTVDLNNGHKMVASVILQCFCKLQYKQTLMLYNGRADKTVHFSVHHINEITRCAKTGLLDNSRICQLADWTTRGLDISQTRLVNSWTRQLAYWTSCGRHRRLCVLSFPFWRHLRDRELSSPRLVQFTSWLVRELSSPRVDQSASWRIRELAYPRVVQ